MFLFFVSSLSLIKFIIFSSALPGYSSWVKLSPDNSSFTLISSKLHKGIIMEISGRPFPHSHFDTVLSLTPSASPNCFWVICFSFLCCAIKLPIFFCSINTSFGKSWLNCRCFFYCIVLSICVLCKPAKSIELYIS